MARYRFVLTVAVDPEALQGHNDRGGLQLDDDPTEWNEDNLALAIGEEVATVESIDEVDES